jgi:hypothetical protein
MGFSAFLFTTLIDAIVDEDLAYVLNLVFSEEKPLPFKDKLINRTQHSQIIRDQAA